jgi:regulatory protein
VKITAIKQQVKRPDRYSIYVDGKYSFSLSEVAFLRCDLASGRELDAKQIDDFKQLSADDKLYNRALRYVAMRQRSVWEVQDYLRRKDGSPELIEEIIGRLQDLGLLDDARYAESFMRDRQLLRPTSRRKLALELKKKHVPEEHVSAAFAVLEVDETQSIQEVIIKKRRQSRYQDDQRLMQYLARQGFGYGDIKAALSQTD